MLHIRMKRYRKAFDIAACKLNDIDFCEHLAQLAVNQTKTQDINDPK